MGQADKLSSFWLNHDVPGAQSDEIAFAERYVGHELPQEFRTLLKLRNGGVSNYSAYVAGEKYFPVLPVFGVDRARPIGSLMSAFDVRVDFDVPEGIVVFAGQGHGLLGFDYRKNPNIPQVVYRHDIDHEVSLVAESFAAFLEGLVDDE